MGLVLGDVMRMLIVGSAVGVAIADEPDAAIEDVIQQADHALYDAKRRGRDRVVAA